MDPQTQPITTYFNQENITEFSTIMHSGVWVIVLPSVINMLGSLGYKVTH